MTQSAVQIRGMKLFLFGTDPRLSFNSDGTRTVACQDILPRPMTLLECEKRAALQRAADGIPEPGTPRHRNTGRVCRKGGPRYPTAKVVEAKRDNFRGGRYPLGRNLADDRLRSGVK